MQTPGNQGTGDGEIHIRGTALARTFVQLSQVGCGKTQPFSPSNRGDHGRRSIAQGVLGC